MAAYYNEIDPFAAEWLRALIRAGQIAPGEVDERSIVDVQPDDLAGFGQCHFFAGIGGWPYALRLAGWPDDQPVWTGSPPCQPWSVAGKGGGRDDARHLAPAFLGLVRACRPGMLFGEQVASAPVIGRAAKSARRCAGQWPEWAWWDALATDLEATGYAAGAAVIPAASVGAWHNRTRLFFGAAHPKRHQQPRPEPCGRPAGRMGRVVKPVSWHAPWARALRRFRIVDDGLSYGVAATDAARNAVVPEAAAAFVIAFVNASEQQRTAADPRLALAPHKETDR